MKNKFIRSITYVSSLALTTACASFGTNPSKKDKAGHESSPNFNKEKGEFENRRPGLIEAMQERTMSWATIKDWLSGGPDRSPKERLPSEVPDFEEFLKPSEDIKTIWFGHSTFLLNLSGKIVLVDPVFSGAASPVSWMVNSFQDPPASLDKLPTIEYVLISHDHYDHLDMESIQFFKEKEVKFIVPLGVSSHLKGWGIAQEKIIEKDWWGIASFDGIEFIATPSQHFSGRLGFSGNQTLWASWVIKTKKHNIYFSGDSGYDTHFKDIGDRYGPFDLAFIESGQYNENWREVHLMPDEALIAYKDLKAKRYFPIHWAMFELSNHTWYEPIEKLDAAHERGEIELVAPRLGQLIYVSEYSQIEKWWKKVKREVAHIVEETNTKVTDLFSCLDSKDS